MPILRRPFESFIIRRRSVSDVASELERYEKARADAIAELGELYEKAKCEIGEEGAQIFDIHAMMLDDEDYNESVTEQIKNEKVNAEYAIQPVIKFGMFAGYNYAPKLN